MTASSPVPVSPPTFPDTAKIPAINFFGSVEVVETLLPRLSAGAKILTISSNSAPQSRNG